MDDFPVRDEFYYKEYSKDLLIAHIRHCEDEIERASIEKQNSEAKLKQLFDHDKDGSTTYDHGKYKVTITTGLNYKFDKKKYADYLNHQPGIDPKFKIVKEVVSLELNKKAIRDCDEFGTPNDKYLKSLFITTSEKKLHISIKASKNESISNDIGNVDDDGVFTRG